MAVKKNRRIGAIIYGICLALLVMLPVGAGISAVPCEVQTDEECAAPVKVMQSDGNTGADRSSLGYSVSFSGSRFGMVGNSDDGQLAYNKETDTTLITVKAAEAVDENGKDAYGLVDDDGDGIIFQEINGKYFVGYMLVVLDPSRVFVGMPDANDSAGMTLEQMVQKYNAKGGINAGGFVDEGGAGNGGMPQGLTIIDGERCGNDLGCVNGLAGFDKDGILHCGFYDYDRCRELGIVNAVSFGPVLICNGESAPAETLNKGINPRTAIGQRADGAVIMLVIDGRQAHSIGANYQDVADVMLSCGAVNACNMDGGSSTVMHYDGEYVNSCSAADGAPGTIPTAFLFK